MILPFALVIGSYHFQPLDFLPVDINDKGWIVGATRRYVTHGFVSSAVLYVDGKTTRLGSYGGSGSAIAVNNRGHVLIKCDAKGLPKTLATKKPGKSFDTARLFWSKGKTTFLGYYRTTGRLLDDDRFLAQRDSTPGRVAPLRRFISEVVKVVNGKPIGKRLRDIAPSNYAETKSTTYFYNMNETGTIVGTTDYGLAASHAIMMDPKGHVTDFYPNVDMHTGWSASDINNRGDVLGYHSYDFSVGGGANFLWRKGKLTDLPPVEVSGLSVNAHSLNDSCQVVGSKELLDSGSYVGELSNKEYYPPHVATATHHAMLWDNDKLYDLNDLTDLPKGCILDSAAKINNKGWIIGTAVLNGKRIGFLLTPNVK